MCFIKKVKFNNYGPFKKQEMSFDNSNSPYFIVGLNDVGKSAVLEGIYSLKNGLGKKYPHQHKTGVEKTSIDFEIEIKEEFYEQFEPKNYPNYSDPKKTFASEWKKEFQQLFHENINIRISSIMETKNLEFDIYNNSPQLLKFINEFVLPKMNLAFKIKSLTLDDLRDDKLKNIINDINSSKPSPESDWNSDSILNQKEIDEYDNKHSKIIKLLTLFKSFKEFLLFVCSKVKLLKTWDQKEFDYLISKHNLSNNNKNVENGIGNIETAAKFLSAFTKKSSLDMKKTIQDVIKMDTPPEYKRNKLDSTADEITIKINNFFEKYFPSNNKIIFKLRMDYDTNEGIYNLNITVSDGFLCDKLDYLEFEKKSEGFKWFLKMYIIISNLKKYDVVLIDEPEKFLHIATLKKMCELMSNEIFEKKITFILATHSPFAIDFNGKNNWFEYKNLRFISKKDGFSHIDDIKNVRNIEQKDLFTIVYKALGFNLYNLSAWDLNKKVIFIEGVADLYTIKVAEHLASEKITDKVFFWPMWGNFSNNIAIARMLNLDFKIFCDGSKHNYQKIKKLDLELDYFVFLGDKMLDEHVSNPEDILSQEHKIELETNLGDDAHCQYWIYILNKAKTIQDFFNHEEKQKFKKYYSIIKNMIK